jgi:hypothetical protein
VSPFSTSARTASETNRIKAGSRSPIARTDRTANHDPVSSKFKTVALSVHVKVCGCRPHGGGAAHTGGRRTQTSTNRDTGDSGFSQRETKPLRHISLVAVSSQPGDARAPVSLTRLKQQLGNAIVGAAEPPTKLAVDILYHHHIRMDVGLVARVEVSGRELVQHGWAFRDDGG